jgi:hypothetical protein
MSTSPGVEPGEHAAELGAIGLRAARHFAEHLARADGPELAHLGVNALAVGRNPCVAIFYGVILHRTFAPETPKAIKGTTLSVVTIPRRERPQGDPCDSEAHGRQKRTTEAFSFKSRGQRSLRALRYPGNEIWTAAPGTWGRGCFDRARFWR